MSDSANLTHLVAEWLDQNFYNQVPPTSQIDEPEPRFYYDTENQTWRPITNELASVQTIHRDH